MNRHWLDDPINMRLLWRVFLYGLAVVVAAELAVSTHPHFAIDAVFGFHAWFGFLACAALILAAKALGLLLKRPDTYYEHRDD